MKLPFVLLVVGIFLAGVTYYLFVPIWTTGCPDDLRIICEPQQTTRFSQITDRLSNKYEPYNYAPGIVLVTFKEGVLYKDAKALLQKQNITIENTNSSWEREHFTPADYTKLKTTDIFTLEVGTGNEDKVINILNDPANTNIVRTASKNYSLKLH